MYPTRIQACDLEQWFGHTRWVWNWGLEACRKAYSRRGETLTSVDLNRMLVRIKGGRSHSWLTDVPAVCLTQKLRDIDVAFGAYFKNLAAHPKFKSRRTPQSARVQFDHRHVSKAGAWASGIVVLPKLGAVKLRGRVLPAEMPKMITVRRDVCGRYWLCFAVAQTISPVPVPVRRRIGIDADVRHFVVLNTGKVIDNLAPLERGLAKFAKLQKRWERQKQNSRRRNVTRKRIARARAHVADARREHLHRVTTWLVNENQVIAVETVPVKEMTNAARGTRVCPGKNVRVKARFNRRLVDASWAEMLRQLEYKCAWYGRTFVKVLDDQSIIHPEDTGDVRASGDKRDGAS